MCLCCVCMLCAYILSYLCVYVLVYMSACNHNCEEVRSNMTLSKESFHPVEVAYSQCYSISLELILSVSVSNRFL